MQPVGRRRLELLVARFVERMRTVGWSERTLSSYRSQLGFFLAYLTDETDVEEVTGVTPTVLHAYQTYLYTQTDDEGRGRSIATQAARLGAVRSLFRFLVSEDVLLYDPAATLVLPRRKKRLPRTVLTKKEIQRLLRAPDATTVLGLRDRAMLEVLYSTGLRNAELRALTVYDVDLEQGLVRVNLGKNDKDRVVPLGDAAGSWLKEYLSEARPKLLEPRKGEPEPVLFLSKNGRPLLPLGVLYPVRKYAKQAGIERTITPHTLRHTFATHLLQGRADLRHIQMMLGHASVATTQIYTRVEVTDLKAVHRRCHPRERR